MTLFRLFLVAVMLTILVYTSVTIANEGWSLIPIFFGDIALMKWPGQFNLDFSCFLLLAAIWVAWRHHFSPIGLALAPVAAFGGMMFMSVYLLINSLRTGGDTAALLLGERRARDLRRG